MLTFEITPVQVISTASPKTDNLPSSFSLCDNFAEMKIIRIIPEYSVAIVLLCTTHQILLKKKLEKI
jgi:hypothetical protein